MGERQPVQIMDHWKNMGSKKHMEATFGTPSQEFKNTRTRGTTRNAFEINKYLHDRNENHGTAACPDKCYRLVGEAQKDESKEKWRRNWEIVPEEDTKRAMASLM